MKIKDYLEKEKIICDGAFGTFYTTLDRETRLPEQGNTEHPETVRKVHRQYLEAGARLIRTNTFASNTQALGVSEKKLLDNIRAGYRNAKVAVQDFCQRYPELDGKIFVAGDMGPMAGIESGDADVEEEYKKICRTFVEEGADILVFETMPGLHGIETAIREIKEEHDVFIIVQFCVNQFGYTNTGLSARRLLSQVEKMPEIDAVGFNCGVGPGHMYRILKEQHFPEGKYITALPNASYPGNIQNRVQFQENEEYFVSKMQAIAGLGIHFIGGCCGTNPDYIKRMSGSLDVTAEKEKLEGKRPEEKKQEQERNNCFFQGRAEGEKMIAVELSPPPNADPEKIMDAANLLKRNDVDVITFPDSPSGRTRTDSILMAVKVAKETGMTVMPHICCRDKNAIAIRSQLLGAHINDVKNFLVITGDPVPTLLRDDVKSVFNFDSVGMMKIMNEMNREEFAGDRIVYGGAINQNRLNLDFEIKRIQRKCAAGAQFFLTQPVFSDEEVERLRRIKAGTDTKILCGIMPLISHRNALFMKNEMTGINVTEEIVEEFKEGMTRAENEAVGVRIAREMIRKTEDFVDGYYFSIPFHRVYLLEEILR